MALTAFWDYVEPQIPTDPTATAGHRHLAFSQLPATSTRSLAYSSGRLPGQQQQQHL